MATKSALVTGVVAFDILKDTRELNGMRMTPVYVEDYPCFLLCIAEAKAPMKPKPRQYTSPRTP
jgi:hypothetical protein